MRGFQPGKQITKRQGYAEGGLVRGFKLMLGIEKSPYAEEAKRYREAQAAKAAQEAAAKQPMQKPLNNISNYSSGEATKRRMAAIDEYADGGMIRGKGTGTSDSIKKDARVGSYIMPADSTEAIGEQTLAGMGKKVPVAVSNGEFEMPPEQVHAIGVQALDQIKNATHTPVARGLPGYTPQNQEPRQFFASGGAVDDMSRWKAASDALRQSNDRIAQSQGRMNIQQPDGRFDENKLAKAAEMVRQSRARMAQNTMLSNRGFAAADVPRQYLAVGGVVNDLDRWRNAANTLRQSDQKIATANTAVPQKPLAAQNSNTPAQTLQPIGSTEADYKRNNTWTQDVLREAGKGWDRGVQRGDAEGAAESLGAAGIGALQAIPAAVVDVGDDLIDNPITRGIGRAWRGGADAAKPIQSPATVPTPASAAPSTPTGQNASVAAAPAVGATAAPAAANSTSTVATELPNGVYQHGRGQYSDNPDGMGFASGFTGRPSAQNMAAMDALAGRSANQISGMAAQQMQPPLMQQQRGFDAPAVQHSGNSWEARNNLRNLQVGMNSMRSTNQSRAAGLAAYKSALDADALARGAENEAGITAMRENAAIARTGMSEAGANQRAAGSNALEAQRIGIAGQEAVFNRGLKGFDVQSAQRRQQIQGMMDAAKTPEERKAIAERFPDVYAGNKEGWKGLELSGGTDALGNKLPSSIGLYNPSTGETRAMRQGAGGDLPTVNSKADMDKLPKGTNFIGVDGKLYTKN